MNTRCLLLCLLMSLALTLPVLGAVVDETELDIQVREIAKTLRCTVCQTENIWESGAPLAVQMRGAIRERLTLGHTPEEIHAYFLSRYGDYILMQPPKHGANWLIWLAPFALLLVGGFFLWKEVKQWVKPPSPQPQNQPPPLDAEARKKIERELQP